LLNKHGRERQRMFEEDRIIEGVTGWFDSNEDLHSASSLLEVESVFRRIEEFCSQNGWHLESDVSSDEFEDVPASEAPEEERTEIKFIVPIQDAELVLEFYYFKEADGLYRINVDIDYYLLEADESDD